MQLIFCVFIFILKFNCILLLPEDFWWSLQGFLYINHIIHIQNFISSFLIWIPFISFSCVIALARASSIMLNRSGENDHSCLFLMLEEKFSAFHL